MRGPAHYHGASTQAGELGFQKRFGLVLIRARVSTFVQVRERRRLKDIERVKSRELQERTREAQRMAEALVRREEEERRRRAKVEEALLNEQMAVIRREMQEQREAER